VSLQSEHEDRTETRRRTRKGLEQAADDNETEVTHEVWALSGDAEITSRTQQLIGEADREIVLVIGHEGIFAEGLVDQLVEAQQRGVNVTIGTRTEELRDQVQEALPETEVFVSGLGWLSHSAFPDDETEIGRLILVDRETILVSSFTTSADEGRDHEQAVSGRGFDNGLVTIVR